MPRINQEAAVSKMVSRCHFLVLRKAQPLILKRVRAVWNMKKKILRKGSHMGIKISGLWGSHHPPLCSALVPSGRRCFSIADPDLQRRDCSTTIIFRCKSSPRFVIPTKEESLIKAGLRAFRFHPAALVQHSISGRRSRPLASGL